VVGVGGVLVLGWGGGVGGGGGLLGSLKSTGLRPRFVDKIAERGVSVPPEIFALNGGRAA